MMCLKTYIHVPLLNVIKTVYKNITCMLIKQIEVPRLVEVLKIVFNVKLTSV